MNSAGHRFDQNISFCYLAWLAVHVERDHDAVCDFTGTAVHQVLSQAGCKIALTCPTWTGQDETAVFEEETDVVLHHGFGNESFKHQAVHTLFFQTWMF